MRLPYMPMWWGDYLADTRRLSMLEHGAYMLLIAHYWTTREPIPDDEGELRRVVVAFTADEWAAVRVVLERHFDLRDGTWHHKRVDEELAKAEDRSARAARAADARWNAPSTARGNAPSNAVGNARGYARDHAPAMPVITNTTTRTNTKTKPTPTRAREGGSERKEQPSAHFRPEAAETAPSAADAAGKEHSKLRWAPVLDELAKTFGAPAIYGKRGQPLAAAAKVLAVIGPAADDDPTRATDLVRDWIRHEKRAPEWQRWLSIRTAHERCAKWLVDHAPKRRRSIWADDSG